MSAHPAILSPVTPKLQVPNPPSHISHLSQHPANLRRRCRRLFFRPKPLPRIDVLVSEFETVATRYFRQRLYFLLADDPLPKSSRDRKSSELGRPPGEEEYEEGPLPSQAANDRGCCYCWGFFFFLPRTSGIVGMN